MTSKNGPSDLRRALQAQSGNYDETTPLIFLAPDGTEYVWDVQDADVDWDGSDMLIYLTERPDDDDES